MRIIPIGLAFDAGCEYYARESAIVSHNHPEGIRASEIVAGSVNQALKGISKVNRMPSGKIYVKKYNVEFGYNVRRSYEEILKTHKYNETCQGTVPDAIVCFLESSSYEDAIRKAIALGGDADTLACIAGGLAEAYYKKIPNWMIEKAWEILPDDMKEIIYKFYNNKFITWTHPLSKQ